MTEIYFHEDDYCQIEVLPVSNWEHCATQIGEIESFSEAHPAPGGTGWTDMYVREENPFSLRDLGISRTTLASALREALPDATPSILATVPIVRSASGLQRSHTRLKLRCLLILARMMSSSMFGSHLTSPSRTKRNRC